MANVAALNPVTGQDVGTSVIMLDPKGRPVITLTESDGSFLNVYVERSNQ
jgi:hypothetical protein